MRNQFEGKKSETGAEKNVEFIKIQLKRKVRSKFLDGSVEMGIFGQAKEQ